MARRAASAVLDSQRQPARGQRRARLGAPGPGARIYPSRSNRQEQFVTYLSWAASLEYDSALTSPDNPDRPANPDSHADPAGRDGPGTPAGPPIPPRPAHPDGLGGRV